MVDDFAERIERLKRAKAQKDGVNLVSTSSINSSTTPISSTQSTNSSASNSSLNNADNNDNAAKMDDVKTIVPSKITDDKIMVETKSNVSKPLDVLPENSKQESDSFSLSDVMDNQKQILAITQSFVDSVNSRLDAIEKQIKSEFGKKAADVITVAKEEKKTCEMASDNLSMLKDKIEELDDVNFEFLINEKRIDELEDRFLMLSDVLGFIPELSKNDLNEPSLVTQLSQNKQDVLDFSKKLKIINSKLDNLEKCQQNVLDSKVISSLSSLNSKGSLEIEAAVCCNDMVIYDKRLSDVEKKTSQVLSLMLSLSEKISKIDCAIHK